MFVIFHGGGGVPPDPLWIRTWSKQTAFKPLVLNELTAKRKWVRKRVNLFIMTSVYMM